MHHPRPRPPFFQHHPIPPPPPPHHHPNHQWPAKTCINISSQQYEFEYLSMERSQKLKTVPLVLISTARDLNPAPSHLIPSYGRSTC